MLLPSTPTNVNFLQNAKWRFVIQRLPVLSFFIQSINVPSLSFGRRDVPTPFVRIPFAGDHLDYGELNVNFKVDENMANYIEVHNWMVGLGFPDSFEQHANLLAVAPPKDKEYSDATLFIQTNAKNVNVNITYHKIFPVFISDLEFDTGGVGNEVDCTVTFAYQKYTITRV